MGSITRIEGDEGISAGSISGGVVEAPPSVSVGIDRGAKEMSVGVVRKGRVELWAQGRVDSGTGEASRRD